MLGEQRRILLSEQEAIRFLDAVETADERTVAPRRASLEDVSRTLPSIQRYDPSRDDASHFHSRQEALDRWLARCAQQSQRRDAARASSSPMAAL